MIVSVSQGGVCLLEPADFKRFMVVSSLDPDLTRTSLLDEAARDHDGDGCWIDLDWINAASGPLASDPAWQGGFAAMLDYAASKGWVNRLDRTVRAHVVFA